MWTRSYSLTRARGPPPPAIETGKEAAELEKEDVVPAAVSNSSIRTAVDAPLESKSSEGIQEGVKYLTAGEPSLDLGKEADCA